jgi:hypothetical protein
MLSHRQGSAFVRLGHNQLIKQPREARNQSGDEDDLWDALWQHIQAQDVVKAFL